MTELLPFGQSLVPKGNFCYLYVGEMATNQTQKGEKFSWELKHIFSLVVLIYIH